MSEKNSIETPKVPTIIDSPNPTDTRELKSLWYDIGEGIPRHGEWVIVWSFVRDRHCVAQCVHYEDRGKLKVCWADPEGGVYIAVKWCFIPPMPKDMSDEVKGPHFSMEAPSALSESSWGDQE